MLDSCAAAKELCLMSSPIQLYIFDDIEVVEFSAYCCGCLCVLTLSGLENRKMCVHVLCTNQSLSRDARFYEQARGQVGLIKTSSSPPSHVHVAG